MKSEILIRAFDIFFSLFFLIIFSPLILLISVLIKLGDLKSPIFVENHWRVGKKNKKFLMYKFRTMIPNAHELLEKDEKFKDLKKKKIENNEKLKIEDDIRITKLGKILRKFDLDELPQFFNVIKGEMSIVGPRAYFEEEIVRYCKKSSEFKKYIFKVLELKPGITGLWQISGRNLLSFEKRVKYDYEYLKKRNLILNILILIKTPYVVLTRYGACD